jgi:glycerol uptake facilitator protein
MSPLAPISLASASPAGRAVPGVSDTGEKKAVEYSLATKLAAEFIGTAILMIFGNGSVANVELKNTKGHHAGWLNIAMGYGFGVMFPVLMFGAVSGAHINPAMTIAQAAVGMFSWSLVAPYIIAQLLGAVAGQLIVFEAYYPHYKETDDPDAIFASFCTTDADGWKRNYFVNEFFGTLILVLGALCCLALPWGQKEPAVASIVVGFIVCGLVTSLGGPTGPGLNPARDLMPRLVHQLLPIPNKGTSHWNEAWIPVVAPIAGAIVGAFIFRSIFA